MSPRCPRQGPGTFSEPPPFFHATAGRLQPAELGLSPEGRPPSQSLLSLSTPPQRPHPASSDLGRKATPTLSLAVGGSWFPPLLSQAFTGFLCSACPPPAASGAAASPGVPARAPFSCAHGAGFPEARRKQPCPDPPPWDRPPLCPTRRVSVPGHRGQPRL